MLVHCLSYTLRTCNPSNMYPGVNKVNSNLTGRWTIMSKYQVASHSDRTMYVGYWIWHGRITKHMKTYVSRTAMQHVMWLAHFPMTYPREMMSFKWDITAWCLSIAFHLSKSRYSAHAHVHICRPIALEQSVCIYGATTECVSGAEVGDIQPPQYW